MNCEEFSKHIGDYVNHKLDKDTAKQAELHLSSCAECATLANEMEKTSLLVCSLERASAPVGFEERLKARLASEKAFVPGFLTAVKNWLRTLLSAFPTVPVHGRRLAVVPALAGLLVCAVIIGSVLMFGQSRSNTPDIDWAYLETCQTQHASFAAANPLADDSAVILKERDRELKGKL
jgi:anti-sigma factor RsiW